MSETTTKEKKVVSADTPQIIINTFGVLDYISATKEDLNTLCFMLESMILNDSNFRKKKNAKEIMAGNYSGTEMSTNRKIAFDLPQRILNIISAVDYPRYKEEEIEGICGRLLNGFKHTGKLKKNWKAYLNVA